MSEHRRLAAIMFTDIVGYTTLMGSDEKKTLALVKRNLKIHKTWIERFGGQQLKEIGDGIMISFQSVSDAVHCAAAIQKETLSELDLNLRIGIHLGEIVQDGQEIYGDGVNVASRIESMAGPGEIYVSEAVFKNIRNKSGIITEFLGSHQLKNVAENVNLYRVSVPEIEAVASAGNNVRKRIGKIPIYVGLSLALITNLLLWFYNRTPGTPKLSNASEQAIAILPFVDLSPEQNQAYLGDGIAAEIINAMSKIPDLKIIGRTSSFSFRDQDIDLQTIGRRLGVNRLLEGSISKSQKRIRIRTQLIDAQDGSQIWADNYERELDDIFEIQDVISRMIAEKLQLSIELSKSESPPTSSFEAYEFYLKGKYELDRGLVGVQEAKDYLNAALEIDPEFVEAHLSLAQIYWRNSIYGLGDYDVNTKLAKESTMKAIELDPKCKEAYSHLGFLNLTNEFDWQAASDNFKQAVDLGLELPDPNYLYYQAIIHGPSEALIADAQQLVANDPLSISLLLDLSRMYLLRREYEEVIRNGLQVLEMSPENTSITRHMAEAYLFSGNIDKALEFYGKLLNHNPNYAPHGYVAALVADGQRDSALQTFEEIKGNLSPVKKAFCYFYLGDLDSGFTSLEQALREKDPFMAFIRVDVNFEIIKNDQRYHQLLKRMNFPDVGNLPK